MYRYMYIYIYVLLAYVLKTRVDIAFSILCLSQLFLYHYTNSRLDFDTALENLNAIPNNDPDRLPAGATPKP